MRLAVISDVHGNLPALEKAFSFIDKVNIDGIIWCGDYVTDILLSHEVLEFIRLKNKKYKHWIIKGNREDYMLDYHNSSDKDFSLIDVTGSLLLTYNSLSEDDMKYISSLSDEIVVDIKGCPKIYVSHKLNSSCGYKYHVFGHIHKQGLFIKNDCRFINPGSVGQCCSGVSGLEFALIELVDGEWNTHFYHMNYDLDFVCDTIRHSLLSTCKYHWDDILIKTLKTGHNYVEDYTNLAKEVSKKCGIDVSSYSVIPDKVWDYAYNKLNIVEKS